MIPHHGYVDGEVPVYAKCPCGELVRSDRLDLREEHMRGHETTGYNHTLWPGKVDHDRSEGAFSRLMTDISKVNDEGTLSQFRLRENEHSLSPAEMTVLRLVIEGFHDKEIAASLSNSYSTIKSHRSQVLKRLGARTMPEAVAIAFRRGILE